MENNHKSAKVSLPPIPAKRYFTIGEVSELCGVKPHVLRYWEQEFTQLKPVKRRGNRRYYQRQDVLTIRQIRSLLYDEGFTIGGARDAWLERGKPDAPLTIDADVRVPWSEVTTVVNLAKRIGVENVQFALGAPPAAKGGRR